MARATLFLAFMILVGWVGFRFLIDYEANRIVSIHATDKARHIAEAFEASPNAPRSFAEGRLVVADFPELVSLARASNVAAMFLVDLEGNESARVSIAAQDDAPSASEAAGRDHNAVHSVQFAEPGQQHPARRPSETRSDFLKDMPMPEGAGLVDLLSGQKSHLVKLDAVKVPDGQTVEFAKVLLPVMGADGDRLGFAGFILDVGHIHSLFSNGKTTYGILFLACGLVLFAVPCFGFCLQRRLAERSKRDANYLSSHDALTGVLNRSAFSLDAQTWLDDRRVGFAGYLDSDRFKHVNETYGHCVGDAFLRHFARIVSAECGDAALIARFGGDDFVVLLPHMPKTEVIATFERIACALNSEVDLDGTALALTVSVGVAEPIDGDTLNDLLHRSETALNFAKSHGRNQIAFFTDEMGAAAQRRCALEARLRQACRTWDFEIHYQPLVDARTGAVLGYEALLRLSWPDGSPISPGEFIPLAEETGLIEDIGTWVIRQATAAIARLDDHSSVSINLSADQFRSGTLIDVVASALDKSGLAPDRLELEVTESLLLQDDTRTKFQIDTLKDMGICVAMDDFGTGFSSLSTLWKYGFNRIKIDKSFVQALEETPERSEQLIDAIVLLGRRMGMSITAEGIETDRQRQVLADMGCNVLQGFLFGHPEPLGKHELAAQGTEV